MASYYYLISSLPMLRAGDAPPLDYAAFLDQCRGAVSDRVYHSLEELTVRSEDGGFVSRWAAFYRVLQGELTYQRRVKRGESCAAPNERDAAVTQTVTAAVNAKDPLEGERLLLALEFDRLDELVGLHSFDDCALYGYALKLQLLERQRVFRHDEGKAAFDTMRGQVRQQRFSLKENGRNKMEKVTGYVTGVNGNLVSARFSGSVRKNEVGFVKIGNDRLKGEVIRISGDAVSMQIYEMTNGIQVGDEVELTGELLSVELGPGLLTQVYDGLQNPLPKLAEQCGFFLERGVYLDPIPDKEWEFTPCVKPGDAVLAGDAVGSVPEGQFTHLIMAPFDLKDEGWRVKSVKEKGVYHVRSTVAVLENGAGEEKALSMVFSWPVKQPIRCYEERLRPDETLVTKIRCIDTFLPVAKGGTFCVPGPFGAGKTVLQHMEAKNADVDIVIVAACGERAGEVVEVLKEFPELTDPRTGRSLMERTIIICNTSSMPVAAREASVYTAVTMAEYYRQMGLNVLLLADSTSRWAQAMREMSGRLEEIPGEEAFPAYLESVIAAFYERAGKVRLRNGKIASVTIGGTVSPAGGNFEEPVTQATLKVVGAFYGLSRERSDARKYPSIHPIDSWSKYQGVVDMARVEEARGILRRSSEINQMMKVIGEEGTSAEDYILYQKGELLDAVYLQQNSFDPIDAACEPERQAHEFNVLYDVLTRDYALSDKKEIRAFFNQVRQEFLDWHGTVYGTPEFAAQETKLTDLYRSKVTG